MSGFAVPGSRPCTPSGEQRNQRIRKGPQRLIEEDSTTPNKQGRNNNTPGVLHTPKKHRTDAPIQGPDTTMVVENKDTQDLLARIEALEAEKKTLAAKHDIDVKRLQTKIEALDAKHIQEMQANDRKVAEMQTLITEKDLKIADLNKRIDALEKDGELSTDDVQRLKDEVEKLKDEVEKLTAKIEVHDAETKTTMELVVNSGIKADKNINQARTAQVLKALGPAREDGTVYIPFHDDETSGFTINRASIELEAGRLSAVYATSDGWLQMLAHLVLPRDTARISRRRTSLMVHIGILS